MQLNVNTDACVVLTDKLERLKRSALPLAVRGTLNDAAFDVKQKTLQESAAKNFIRRSPSFFKTFSAVNKATGFNISSMKAEVGMTDRGKATARNAVAKMEKQEHGGLIDNGLDYLSGSRVGSKYKGKVKRINYYDKRKVISGRSRAGRGKGTAKSKFVARAYRAAKEGKPMFFNSLKGNYLMSVIRVKKNAKGKIKIRSRLLLKTRKGHPVVINPTHFSKEAALKTIRKIEGMYVDNAKKQFARIMR